MYTGALISGHCNVATVIFERLPVSRALEIHHPTLLPSLLLIYFRRKSARPIPRFFRSRVFAAIKSARSPRRDFIINFTPHLKLFTSDLYVPDTPG